MHAHTHTRTHAHTHSRCIQICAHGVYLLMALTFISLRLSPISKPPSLPAPSPHIHPLPVPTQITPGQPIGASSQTQILKAHTGLGLWPVTRGACRASGCACRGRFGLGDGVSVEAPKAVCLFKLPQPASPQRLRWGQADSCYKMKPVFSGEVTGLKPVWLLLTSTPRIPPSLPA